jgi:glutamyl-tRNA synthetase
MDENNLELVTYKYALVNATSHTGKAQNGAVMGLIMSNHPELRSQAAEIAKVTGKAVSKVNKLTLQEQKEELDKMGGYEKEEKEVEDKTLPELPQAKKGVTLRFAPNPSGPLHIGHARAAVLNQDYQERYDGKLILRIEDTDPRRVYTPAYQMIKEDLKWLGVDWQEEAIQSERLTIYYEQAQKAIEQQAAYMCTCQGEKFKKLKDQSQSCPHRDLKVEENLDLWEKMPEMAEGEAVLRIKTDLNHKNPAIRDWVAMRIVDAPHPLLGNTFRIYPMMNFSVAVDDHLMGVTHVLRGKDHLANTEKQGYLYQHMGWEEPHYTHYGRLKMDDVALSTSQAKKSIESGEYSGWDDPRLGTLRAIARRGIQPQAIQELMREIGVKIADSIISWKKIYGLNRNLIEEVNRYFLTSPAKHIQIEGLPDEAQKIVERPLHPDHPERGMRKIPFNNKVYISSEDITKNPQKIIRLMDAVNIYFPDSTAVYHSTSFEEARKVGATAIQWVPSQKKNLVEMVMPDASRVVGYAEPDAYQQEVGDVIQFERMGFARLDEKYLGKMTFYFAHK